MAMGFQDEKGKFFTDVVSKVTVPVFIQTVTHGIRGDMHIRPDQRLKDELDLSDSFLAITDAVILGPDGKELNRTNFLAVRRDQIVWVMPIEEEK